MAKFTRKQCEEVAALCGCEIHWGSAPNGVSHKVHYKGTEIMRSKVSRDVFLFVGGFLKGVKSQSQQRKGKK